MAYQEAGAEVTLGRQTLKNSAQELTPLRSSGGIHLVPLTCQGTLSSLTGRKQKAWGVICLGPQGGSGEDTHQDTAWKPAPGVHPALCSSGPRVGRISEAPCPVCPLLEACWGSVSGESRVPFLISQTQGSRNGES